MLKLLMFFLSVPPDFWYEYDISCPAIAEELFLCKNLTCNHKSLIFPKYISQDAQPHHHRKLEPDFPEIYI